MTTTPDEIAAKVVEFQGDIERLQAEIAKAVVGQEEIVRDVVRALLAGGHVLLEGVPGLGKTLLVRTLAESLALPFSRIQFTPDLMPADITGTNIVVEDASGRRSFEFQRGPVFAGVVLADEINRATPKTQSAMLEAMQEATVTVSGIRHELPQPFFVLATQNPIEMEGTYPLPEAQLDRFLFKLAVGFPDRGELVRIFSLTTGNAVAEIDTVLDARRILEMRALARDILVADTVADYAARLVMATHPECTEAPTEVRRFVRYGASPRGGQAMILAAKVGALMDGRYNVSFADLRDAALPSLRHRLILNFEGEAEGKSTDDVIQAVLDATRP